MISRSIATVCLGGALDVKLAAAAKAGFRAIELFENDLTFFSGGATGVSRFIEAAGGAGVQQIAFETTDLFSFVAAASAKTSERGTTKRKRRPHALMQPRINHAETITSCMNVAEGAYAQGC